MSDKTYVVPIEEVKRRLGKSLQAENVLNYLNEGEIKTNTAIIEKEYIDKDYLLDYAGFYSRSFEKIDKFTERIHFFSGKFDQDVFEDVLENYNKENKNIIENLGEYNGFVVLKPLSINLNKKPSKMIGRSLLRPLPEKVINSTDLRKFIFSEYKLSLYGLDLCIKSLPFQVQDRAVSACATVSLWIANSQLANLFQTPRLSPLEVTKRATRLIGEARSLPNAGLTPQQMFAFLESIALDFEVVSPYELRSEYPEINTVVPDTVKIFIDENFPIIATLLLIKYKNKKYLKKNYKINDDDIAILDYHAAVISGYREDNEHNLNMLYVHDDEIGPYIEVESSTGEDFFKWENEWINDRRYGPYDEVILESLILPLYPKIRMGYKDIYIYLEGMRKKRPNCDIQLRLTNNHELKNKIINSSIKNKLDVLKRPMPRFMWAINVSDKAKNYNKDHIIDATSHKLRFLCKIDYATT